MAVTADWLLTAIVLGGHGLLVVMTGRGDIFGAPDREQRLEIYTTGATVVALVGSFVTAAIAQYASATGRRMRVLRTAPHLASQFRRNWVSVLSATLFISAVCLLAIVLDTTETDPGGVHWAVEGALILGAAPRLSPAVAVQRRHPGDGQRSRRHHSDGPVGSSCPPIIGPLFDPRHSRGILSGSIGGPPAPYGRLSELLGRVLMLRASRREDRKRVPQYSSP